jgi:hypothetical protein
MLARKPAIGGARPPWPLISVALLAKLPPGLTSIGQMDCPIWAMALLTGPLLPMPTPLSTGAIASPAESACAAGIDAKATLNTAAVTITGRRTAVDDATISAAPHASRPAFDLVRPLVGWRNCPAVLLTVMWNSPPSPLHAHKAQISL